jgi:predicted Fe-S protein YdhL (DUF1289 family)|tara:strand:+ start:402 stop:548 length:147 start_codon:yes stop_codon:yes gene_type:complete
MSTDGKLCIGCGRSMEEIVNWAYLSNDEKEKIIQKIYNRSILKKISNE